MSLVLSSDINVEDTESDKPRIENDEERLKTRKIRIYPTPEEREKLRKRMGTVRWTYNIVLEMVQDDGITDMSAIRKRYLNNNKCFTEEFLWVKETPREILTRDWNRNRGEYAFPKSIITSERPPEINNTEYKYCKVIQCTEEYTSKTCGHCGKINGKLGDSKTFWCNSCEVDGSGRERGEEHLTQIVNGGSGFGLTLGLEPLWDTI
ncbi:11065_t:CDS:2 [Funneliformis mosseae]|uniref:11065_t:CDS:1 n=1 Tax=Funneliformis mosseae TaxID=27381 RepID=A0A9N9FSS6_FUNMO|nr:11065_t:CDS:2 [Funneliformis mosseae]